MRNWQIYLDGDQSWLMTRKSKIWDRGPVYNKTSVDDSDMCLVQSHLYIWHKWPIHDAKCIYQINWTMNVGLLVLPFTKKILHVALILLHITYTCIQIYFICKFIITSKCFMILDQIFVFQKSSWNYLWHKNNTSAN